MTESIQLGRFSIRLENGKLVIDADSSEKQKQAEARRESRLLASVKTFLEENDGFRMDSELCRKYHQERGPEVRRLLPMLEVLTFSVQHIGRPATYYVLPDHIDDFQRYAEEKGWINVVKIDSEGK